MERCDIERLLFSYQRSRGRNNYGLIVPLTKTCTHAHNTKFTALANNPPLSTILIPFSIYTIIQTTFSISHQPSIFFFRNTEHLSIARSNRLWLTITRSERNAAGTVWFKKERNWIHTYNARLFIILDGDKDILSDALLFFSKIYNIFFIKRLCALLVKYLKRTIRGVFPPLKKD